MRKQKPYAELASQAEKAVGSIKDPELRRVAFERVLEDLISGEKTQPSSGTQSAKMPKGKAQRSTARQKRQGPKGYVRELVEDGFFKKPKTIAEVKAELSNRGHHIALTSLSGPLQALCQDRVLRRQKAKDKGKKETFSYSEW